LGTGPFNFYNNIIVNDYGVARPDRITMLTNSGCPLTPTGTLIALGTGDRANLAYGTAAANDIVIDDTTLNLIGTYRTAYLGLKGAEYNAYGPPPDPNPAVVVSFTATPLTIDEGEATSLSWSTSNATSCTATGGAGTWGGTVATSSGGTSSGAIATAGGYTFTLTCTGPGGASAPASVTVTVEAEAPAATPPTFVVAVRQIETASTAHDVTLTGLQVHDTVGICVLDRTGTLTVSSVADDEGGTYTLRLSGASTDNFCYDRSDIAAPSGGSLVITVTSTGAVNSQVLGYALRSASGGSTFPAFVSSAAVSTGTGTAVTSNTLVAADPGMFVGFLKMNNAQGTLPTIADDGTLTGEQIVPAGVVAGMRAFLGVATNPSAGTRGLPAITLGTSATWGIRSMYYVVAP
jgi:hypothetical protein